MNTQVKPQSAPSRGKPMVALFAVVGIWIALRVVFWQSPLASAEDPLSAADSMPANLAMPLGSTPLLSEENSALPRVYDPAQPDWTPAPLDPRVDQPVPYGPITQQPLGAQNWDPQASQLQSVDSHTGDSQASVSLDREDLSAQPIAARRIVGHNLLLAAGLSQLPISPLLERYVQGRGPVANSDGVPEQGVVQSLAQGPAHNDVRPEFAPAAARRFEDESAPSRWSGDAWALWRKDMASTPLASTQPSYGRSQIGAVLRYSLAPDSGHRPQAYVRASSALEGPREREVALGLSGRPLARVPVRIAAEGRLSDRTETRAAAYAVSEFPSFDLPAGLTGEAYVQAGYVTGDFDTGFVDGQARVTRDLGGSEDFRLSAGGGAWGGAQEGASRLDVGPSATVSFRLGDSNYGRLSADYRIRVAGDAVPASGPALTLSAGF